MKTRSFGLLLLTFSALLGLAVLGGNSSPMCQPVEPGAAVCLTALDCGDAPDCASDNATDVGMVGSWTCVDASCVAHCETPGECSAEDCGPAMGMPNWLCPDGSLRGPNCERLADGSCGWMIHDCPPVDMDGDGFAYPQDCDDSNASVHPGAYEACDNLDNDCDGMVDEGCFECMSDEDCPEYWSCALLDCATDPNTGVDCGAGGVCVADEPYPQPCAIEAGQTKCPEHYECECLAPPDCAWCEMCYMGCVLLDGVCWDDGDCESGETCEGASICPPGAYCFAPDTPGECEKKDDEPMPCAVDSAGQYWCPEGYYCDTCLSDPDCPVCAVCWAGCVAY